MAVNPPSGYEPFNGGGSFVQHVGPVYARGEGDDRVFGLRVDDRHLNSAGAVHGGLLTTIVDFALGRAIENSGDGARVTVSLTTDFLGAVSPGAWVEAHTEVERLGGTLAFADCSLKVDDREIVRGRGVFAAVS
jgi:uncharacterized protein (TIGR00369 family)